MRTAMRTPDKTVLLVDDDPAICSAVARLLEAEGLSVVIANELPSARRQLKSVSPDVVVLDLQLGSTHGEQLRADLGRSRVGDGAPVPVIILSGLDEIEANWSASRLGAVSCIEKPFEPQRLARVVLAAADRVYPQPHR